MQILEVARIKLQPGSISQSVLWVPATSEIPGGPASFEKQRSGGPVGFWDIHKV